MSEPLKILKIVSTDKPTPPLELALVGGRADRYSAFRFLSLIWGNFVTVSNKNRVIFALKPYQVFSGDDNDKSRLERLRQRFVRRFQRINAESRQDFDKGAPEWI